MRKVYIWIWVWYTKLLKYIYYFSLASFCRPCRTSMARVALRRLGISTFNVMPVTASDLPGIHQCRSNMGADMNYLRSLERLDWAMIIAIIFLLVSLGFSYAIR